MKEPHKNRTIVIIGEITASILLTLLLLVTLQNVSLANSSPAAKIGNPVLPVLADFEGGLPPGFFVYNGASTVTAVTEEIGPTSPYTLPGQVLTNTVLSVTFNVFDYGGFGRDLAPNPQDWSSYDGFSFWFYGVNSGVTYQAEIMDNRSDPNSDTAERFDYEFVDNFNGWRHVNIPFDAFTRAVDFQPPGAPDDGLTLTEMWGFAFPLFGNSAVYIDQVELVNYTHLADFEPAPPPGFFVYNGASSVLAVTEVISPNTPIALPGQVLSNTALSVTFNVFDYGGFGRDLAPTPQDWSGYDGFSFWFYGVNSGVTYQAEIMDNRSDPNSDTAERFDYEFVDDFTGWRHMSIPFDAFTRAVDFQPPGAPDDGLTLTEMWGFAFPLFGNSAVYFDEVGIYGDVAGQELKVQFDSFNYSVTEGDTATITVTLNMTAAYPVTVTYATADGTATSGSDYNSTAGTLTFPANTSSQSFTVSTIDDGDDEPAETVLVNLSNPISVTLGSPNQATLKIIDNEVTIPTGKSVIIDDFESGLPSGTDPNGIDIGFVTWSDGSPVAITVTGVVTSGTPPPVPGVGVPNTVLQFDSDIGGWGGFTHAFENGDVTQWVPQDWSTYEGVSFWLHGNGSGVNLFVDILDNRNPGSTTDDAERFTYGFTDDIAGWRYIEIPFGDFSRKEIGNGAPDDGLTLTEVHGWALGSLSSGGPQTHYIDQVGLLMRTTVIDDFESGLPSGTDPNGIDIGFVTWSDGSPVAITVTGVVTGGTPPPVPGIGVPNTVLQFDSDIGGWGGFTHAFENGDVTQWVPQDWSTYEGICFWLHGNGNGVTLFVDILDNRNPGSTTDDAERFTYGFADDTAGWQLIMVPFSDFSRKEIGNGAPDDGLTLTEVHGWALGSLSSGGPQTHYIDQVAIYGNTGGNLPLELSYLLSSYDVAEGDTAAITATLNVTATFPVTVNYSIQPGSARPYRDYMPVSGTLVFAPGEKSQSFAIPTLDDPKDEGGGSETAFLYLTDPVSVTLGYVSRATLHIVDNDPYDPALLADFEETHYHYASMGNVTLGTTELVSGTAMALPGQWLYENVLTAGYDNSIIGGDTGFGHTLALNQDWSIYQGLSFWYYGSNSGDTITVEIQDNRAPDPGPSGWSLVWSDEFDDPAGTPPNPATWTPQIGDGAINGITGWGNGELEYYTDSTDNAATDGLGNLVITAMEVDTATTTLECWYGPCQYTSARLMTADKYELAYGRVEARIRVPFGQGIWPAFWMLGGNLDQVGWPNSGEIDIMENIGSEPATVHGTVHGPGYSGCCGLGGSYTLPSGDLSDDFHVFAIEWEPDVIRWYIDGINYFTATAADVPAGSEWVFDHPFYLLLNVAVGGNWPGSPDGSTTFPQTMHVDYVRVYQAPDTAERFEATFIDSFNGWAQVILPFNNFSRRTDQPVGAPNDGFNLSEAWGYGFEYAEGTSGSLMLDQVRLEPVAADPTGVSLSSFSGQSGSNMFLFGAALLIFLALVQVGLRRKGQAAARNNK